MMLPLQLLRSVYRCLPGYPLIIATGAGNRRSLGTAIFSGMVAASILVPLMVPLFYFVVQSIREKARGVSFDKPRGEDAEAKSEVV